MYYKETKIFVEEVKKNLGTNLIKEDAINIYLKQFPTRELEEEQYNRILEELPTHTADICNENLYNDSFAREDSIPTWTDLYEILTHLLKFHNEYLNEFNCLSNNLQEVIKIEKEAKKNNSEDSTIYCILTQKCCQNTITQQLLDIENFIKKENEKNDSNADFLFWHNEEEYKEHQEYLDYILDVYNYGIFGKPKISEDIIIERLKKRFTTR